MSKKKMEATRITPRIDKVIEMDFSSFDPSVMSNNYNDAINELRKYIESGSRAGKVDLEVELPSGKMSCTIDLKNIYILEFSIKGKKYKLDNHNYSDSTNVFSLENGLNYFGAKDSLNREQLVELCDISGNAISEAIRFSIIQEYIANKLKNGSPIDLNEQLYIRDLPLSIMSNDKILNIKELRGNWEKLSEQKRQSYTSSSLEGEGTIFNWYDILALENVIESPEKKNQRRSSSLEERSDVFRVFSPIKETIRTESLLFEKEEEEEKENSVSVAFSPEKEIRTSNTLTEFSPPSPDSFDSSHLNENIPPNYENDIIIRPKFSKDPERFKRRVLENNEVSKSLDFTEVRDKFHKITDATSKSSDFRLRVNNFKIPAIRGGNVH